MNWDNKNQVPQWMAESKTATTEQNNEVGLIVAEYIGGFRKRGFSENQIAQLLAKAFLLPASEVFERVDAVLSCGEENEAESAKNLCVYVTGKGELFSPEDTDPCEIIEYLKNTYGKTAAFETLLTFPEILLYWKRKNVRDLSENKSALKRVESILNECASVFPEKK